ncbi:hypothetical protein N7478_011822 [Penicillium angulare]|uniref:uncharacterized protein n=1 Tax=Penicillium angulare TaxID=116970 RepID=UPI00253F7D32|nr:uncharacterized protein N7478_011822 [Penicillium angulare]KAJ5261227.1 hypothetical protein N7478_011822 [Penicillium angulare]
MHSIASLPVELISEICNHLDLQQWFHLRLSCRALYNSSLESFAETYYKKIRFIVTSESLHRLEELSKSNVLREHVQELWMIPTVFGGTEEHMGMVSISSKSCRQVKGDELNNRHAIHKAMLVDNSNLLESETLSVRLRACLDSFQNLQSIGLAHYTTEFLLDPRQETVPFLGRRQMMSRIDFRFDVYSLRSMNNSTKGSPRRQKNSLAVSKLLLALCGSRCRPRKLYTCDSHFCGDIGPKLALSEEHFESLLSALNGLEDLHLCIDLNQPPWLKLITHLAPRLERLTFSQDHTNMPAYSVESYIGNTFHEIHFTRLRELHLHELAIYFNPLKSLLLSVKENLVILTLERVTIRSEVLRSADETSSQQSEPPVFPTSPGLHPTSPVFHPESSPYPFRPTMPSFRPTMPSFRPTMPSFRPTTPSGTPLPVNDPEPPQYPPPSPQHSSTSESSEPMIENLIDYWPSTYHPYSPPRYAHISLCPTRETEIEWKRHEKMVTCMSGLLNIIKNDLSLENLSLEDVICDGNYYYFRGFNESAGTSGRVDFDSRNAGILLGEWISSLRPEASYPGYRVLEFKEDEGD